jgi:DMSO/TMAO reductase YedYZ molybdopterin-dependent catalytic subunit
MSAPRPADEVIVSPDTRRAERLPPRQALTRKWPVLHYGEVPPFDPAAWDFTVFGPPLVKKVVRFTWDEFRSLPRVKVLADMHCVTRWSKLDNLWEGVSTREVLSKVRVSPRVRFVMVHCEPPEPGDPPFTTNLPLADFLGDDCLFAWSHGGQPLEPDHGYPLRLVVPRLYAWKSAKWVRGVELIERDRAGFWERHENGGYHMRGDPWTESRFRDDG